MGFFVKTLIETNVNTCLSNELNISDVDRNVNYSGSLAKFTWTSLEFIHFASDPK